MHVLFVYMGTNSSEPPRIGLGVAVLSGYLKKHGIETDLCYYRDSRDEEHCLGVIAAQRSSLIAISSVTSSFFAAKYLIASIKRIFPGIFIICGGAHVSVFPEEISETPGLDAVCVGYGEEALLELAQSIGGNNIDYTVKNIYFNANGAIIRNALRPFPVILDKYFPEDREIFAKEFTRMGIRKPAFDALYEEFIFCRGCPFNCTFCCNHRLKTLGTGSYLAYPSVEASIAAIAAMVRAKGIMGVQIHDDILTLNKPWLRDFADQYARRIGLPFVCNLRIGTFTEDDVRLLKQANCKKAIVGIESGNEYIRDTIMDKKIGPNEKIIAAFKLLHRHGIATGSQNMIGLPEEDLTRFYDTVAINARILPNMATISVFYPYPGTRLHTMVIEKGLGSPAAQHADDHFIERKSSCLSMPQFPKKSIEFYAKNFKYMVNIESVLSRLPFGSAARRFIYANHFTQRALFTLLYILTPVVRLARAAARRE